MTRDNFSSLYGHQESGRVNSLSPKSKGFLEEISRVFHKLYSLTAANIYITHRRRCRCKPRNFFWSPLAKSQSLASTSLSSGKVLYPCHQRFFFFFFVLYSPTSFFVASDPAQNPYWKRDVRRAYPQLSVVTQSELSSLLIAHSSPPQVYVSTNLYHIHLLTPPSSAAPVEGQTEVPVVAQKTPELSEAIATITGATKVYSESKLPPTLPIPHKRWVPRLSPDAPHDQFAYFPMSLYQ